ncbi:hypothetical protein BHM03_00057128 [Ensete ventricosum]|nr:hypothetical protein BHM03_00057128 [Ensete ventricosum]
MNSVYQYGPVSQTLAVLETVAIITHDKSKKNDTREAKYGTSVIVGYLLAGSLIGPGGLRFISEIVQVNIDQLRSRQIDVIICKTCCGLAMARLRENHRKKKERAFEEEGELREPRRKLVSTPFLDPDLAPPFLDDPDPGLARRVVKRRIWRFDAFFAKG